MKRRRRIMLIAVGVVVVVATLTLGGCAMLSMPGESFTGPLPVSMVYGSRGDFIGFVGNTASAKLTRRVVGVFREQAKFPSQGIALPGMVDGAGWSDHWSFWQHDYPVVMVTDTLPFRYEHYHTAGDTPDKIDFDRMARVVEGLGRIVEDLAEMR